MAKFQIGEIVMVHDTLGYDIGRARIVRLISNTYGVYGIRGLSSDFNERFRKCFHVDIVNHVGSVNVNEIRKIK